LIEVSEAITPQVLAFECEMKRGAQKRNIKGDTIAFGHPMGYTDAKVTATLLHCLIREEIELTLCLSGGQGGVTTSQTDMKGENHVL